MSSLVYLLAMGLKNRVLETIRKPAKLAVYLLVIAVIVYAFLLPMITGGAIEDEDIVDIIWLKGMFFALILLYFVTAIIKGLKSGDVIFDMSDVNLLFVSPVNSRSILLYGVVRMMGMSLLMGFFILFQGNAMRIFGASFTDVLLVLAGYILAVSLLQIVSLLIYSLTNGKPKRKMFVRIVSTAVFLPMITEGFRQYLESGGDMMTSLEALLRSPVTSWTPVVGWASEGTIAFVTGNLVTGFVFFGVILAAGAALIICIMFSNPDYFEDVLVATETTFEKKRAVMEGQADAAAVSGRKIKVAATGVRGSGGSAIFYKHLRESFRANRFGLWGVMSLFLVVGSAIFSVIMRRNDAGGLIILMQMLFWMQIFLIGTGRGLKELYSHYIYMIPEPSFSKIIWSNLELVFKVFVEALFVFTIAGAILNEPPLQIAAAMTAYVLFALLLIGINYLSFRWTGVEMGMGLQIIIYFLAVCVIMLPGIIPAVIVGTSIDGWGIAAGLGILAAWELIAALACFALSKGILHRCDMPVIKVKKA